MLKWIGDRFGVDGWPGIPARDLTEAEVDALGGEVVILATGLYERPPKPAPAKVIRPTHEPEEDTADDA